MGGISLLYGLHAFIWHRPKQYAELCKHAPLKLLGSHPVDIFAVLEILGKIWQLSCLVMLVGLDGAATAARSLAVASGWTWAVFAFYVGFGQGLNVAMYNAIGNAGVYYGWKLGRPVPWCTAFPFNAGLRHPQYVGVVLTLVGGLAPLLCEASVRNGLVQAALAWAGMYVVMAAMEQWSDAKDDKTS